MTEDEIFYQFPTTVVARDAMQAAVAKKSAAMEEAEERKERKKQKVADKLEDKFGPGASENKEINNKKERQRQKIAAKLEAKFGPGASQNKAIDNRPGKDGDSSVSKKKREQEREEKLASNVQKGFFIPNKPAHASTESGYSINKDFAKDTREAALNLLADEHIGLRRQKLIKKKWDTKKDKFVGKRLQEKKIKTESGR